MTNLVGYVGSNQQQANPSRQTVSYLLRIPSNGADSLSTHIIESEALLLRLDVPNCDKPSTATSDQNVRNLPVPVQAFNVICASCCGTQAGRFIEIIEVGDEQLALRATSS